jgi:hypothetical protein
MIVLEYLFLLINLTAMTSTHQVLNSIKYLKSEFELDSHRKVIPPEYARIEPNFPTLALNCMFLSIVAFRILPML